MPPASSNAGGSRGGSGDEILGAAGEEILFLLLMPKLNLDLITR